jgi:hypothetical protein
MGKPLYAYWSDNALSLATVSAASTLALYPVAGAYDGNPAMPVKFSIAVNAAVVLDFGSAMAPKGFAVIHHNLSAALNVRVQSSTASDFSSLDCNQPFTIGAVEVDGYRPDIYLDLQNALGGAVTARRYWRVIVLGTNTNNVIMGEVFGYMTRRELIRGVVIGHEEGPTVRNKEHFTEGDVSLAVKEGFRREYLTGTMRGTKTDTDAVMEWFRAVAGNAEPSLLIPDQSLATVFLGRWDADTLRRRSIDGDVYEVTITFRQLSRGLIW